LPGLENRFNLAGFGGGCMAYVSDAAAAKDKEPRTERGRKTVR
jgi:hypothetical protein